ncbi:redox-sensitive transcriptional activator SoxR [Marinagarivorans algicola]|uniref:redox-sensitive transcriptional activator SoxR n=1 Tax=Marinagarivorans algicola TaxID=1513270 RepID=UPI0006B4489A|nr:redox-sensitive transcriptional activator SoxR [Marinagarivorans algicola]
MKKDTLMSIGQVAERTGAAVSAIRFYADEQLLPVNRTTGGRRLFERSVIRRVSFILISQQLGYSLSHIKQVLASLPNERTPTKADWEKLSRGFAKDIDQKVAQLQTLKASLSTCIGCGCLSLQKCRLYNPDDKINQRGSGPRYLLGDSAVDLEEM